MRFGAPAVRGRTGAAGACATLGHAARGAVARAVAARSVSGALAERARGHRRDFAKGLCEGTFRRDKLGLFEGTFEEGLSKGLSQRGSEHLHNGEGTWFQYRNRFLPFKSQLVITP